MVQFVISVLLLGMVVGYLARLLVPGPDPMSLLETVVLGVVGSFVGGVLGYLVLGRDADEGLIQVGGYLDSLVGAIITLLVYNRYLVHRMRRHY